jgi:hypothetical protein
VILLRITGGPLSPALRQRQFPRLAALQKPGKLALAAALAGTPTGAKLHQTVQSFQAIGRWLAVHGCVLRDSLPALLKGKWRSCQIEPRKKKPATNAAGERLIEFNRA